MEDIENILPEVIKDLNILLNDWDNEILSVVVHSGKFKVRHAWFQSVLFLMGSVKELNANGIKISDTALELMIKVEYLITSDNFKSRMTTVEDIELVDSMLSKILKEIN